METLRKAIGDNRDVYVSVINKSNLEQEERVNGFVEDLEKVVESLYEVQLKQESIGTNSGEEVVKVSRQINDLEAHLNTSVITEKSVRKAQDKYLAEEIDKFQKQVSALSDKLKMTLDEEGNIITGDQSKNEKMIGDLSEEIVTLKD